jgi:hypothetical protein
MLNNGTSAVSGQIVRASVETTSGSASGTLDDGNAYPDAPLQDNGDGTYSTQITAGSGEGSLTVRFKINCCDDAVPAPPENCDEFSPTATLVVSSAGGGGDDIFDDDFEEGHTGNWSSTVPPP